MMIEDTIERIKLLQRKINNTLVIEKAAAYQEEIDELIDEANRLSIDLTEYITEHEQYIRPLSKIALRTMEKYVTILIAECMKLFADAIRMKKGQTEEQI